MTEHERAHHLLKSASMSIARSISIVFASTLAWAAAACEQASQPAQAAASESKPRLVPVRADDKGFSPSHIEVHRGEAVTLRFTRTSEKTCADRVVFPEIDVEQDLPLGRAVDIEVPTDRTRRLTFQCGMGMYKSAVLVN